MQTKELALELQEECVTPSTRQSPGEDASTIATLQFDSLQPKHFYAYGVGHFFNDLTAAYWFNFAIYYLVTVVNTPAAGFAFLMGQLTDSLTTPLAGYASDNLKTKMGQRVFWYAFGFIVCIFSFPMIFRNIEASSVTKEYVYYGCFASLFNFGWAFGQISHLSLPPALSCSRLRRERLNNLRNTFTFVANFLLLAMLSLLFSLVPDYSNYYFEMAVLVVCVGSVASIFFLWNINEEELTVACQQHRSNLVTQLPEEIRESELQAKKNFKWSVWLKDYRFYFFGLAYICSRLSVNMMATLLPFFIKIRGSSQYTTYIIMILYICSIVTSAKTPMISTKVGQNKTLIIGVAFSIVASFMLYINPDTDAVFTLIVAASFIGISQAIIMNSVINFICGVIGARSERGASVFGMYSFVDKIVTGVAVYLVTLPDTIEDTVSLQRIILLVPPSLGILSCMWVFFTVPKSRPALVEQISYPEPYLKRITDELVM